MYHAVLAIICVHSRITEGNLRDCRCAAGVLSGGAPCCSYPGSHSKFSKSGPGSRGAGGGRRTGRVSGHPLYREGRQDSARSCCRLFCSRGHPPGAGPWRKRLKRPGRRSTLSPRPGPDRLSASVRDARSGPADCGCRRHFVCRRADAAHHSRPEHGRALVDGQPSPVTRLFSLPPTPCLASFQ